MTNFERLIRLADDTFDVRNDPEQLSVDEKVMERLECIHPSTLSEEDYGDGPVAWVLLIPTRQNLMVQFLEGKISERALFEKTPLNQTYDCIYLCSALVLEEYRKKGISKRLCLAAIETIMEEHPISALFVWPFSKEGEAAAESLAHAINLPLFKRGNSS